MVYFLVAYFQVAYSQVVCLLCWFTFLCSAISLFQRPFHSFFLFYQVLVHLFFIPAI